MRIERGEDKDNLDEISTEAMELSREYDYKLLYSPIYSIISSVNFISGVLISASELHSQADERNYYLLGLGLFLTSLGAAQYPYYTNRMKKYKEKYIKNSGGLMSRLKN